MDGGRCTEVLEALMPLQMPNVDLARVRSNNPIGQDLHPLMMA